MKWLRPSDERVRAIAAYEKGVTTEIQAAVAGPLSGPQPKRTPVIPPAARSDLRSAAKQFDAALAADPAFAKAALHLGRVTLLDGRDADAERWLGIASEAQSSSTRYLAQMFLGATAERQARYDEAIKRYEAAHTAFRWGQAAPLALSHVLMRAGREREARDALDAHFTAPSGRVVEPLWTYLSDSSTVLGPMLDLLRAEVWR